MPATAHAKTLRFDRSIQHKPALIVTHAQPWNDYLKEKCRAQKAHIEYLQQQLGYKKWDLIAAWSAVGCLLITLGIVLYQWLIVCAGNAPG